MIIKNVLVYGEDKTFKRGEIAIADGVFTDVLADKDAEEIDGGGCYAIPGLIDIHFHGCMGYDFCDGTHEAMEAISRYEESQGITTMIPATMTLSEEELTRIMSAAKSYQGRTGAKLSGINMEGPFFNKEKKGAQSDKYIKAPDIELFLRLQRAAGGLIKLVDIAPETAGADEFIQQLKDQVVISFAHTAADYNTAQKGFASGASHVTHLFNAMLPFSHREPGLVGAAFDNPDVKVELICDGVHIHPAMVRAAYRMFGDDRIVLVSDSMRATGMADGIYTLGGQAVKVEGNRAALIPDGNLAGSVTNLMDCLRTAVRDMGIPLESAVAGATMNPAKSVGIYHTVGSISQGKCADVVLLSADLQVKQVIHRGQAVSRNTRA